MKKALKIFLMIALIVPIMLVATACNNTPTYQRHQQSDPTINAQLENQIRQSFVESFGGHGVTFENTYILGYYGTYNGTSAIRITSTMLDYPTDVPEPEIIAGVTFFAHYPSIVAWKDGTLYSLQKAYDDGLLTVENLRIISYTHKGISTQGNFFILGYGEYGELVNFPMTSYSPDHMPIPVSYNMVLTHSSVEQMQALFGETYSQSYHFGFERWERDERFTDFINGYDNAFFESKQLVTFILGADGSADPMFELSKVTLTDKLTIEVNQLHITSNAGPFNYYVGFVEIGKVPNNIQIEIVVK